MTKSGKPSGMPNGRPTKAITDDSKEIRLNTYIPHDVVRKIDSLRQGAETRKDVIVRILRECQVPHA